jgi:hypothetical protein
MPGFVGGHHYAKMGSFRGIFVVGGDTAGDALDRAMGANYTKMPPALIFEGQQGMLWNGRDPDEGSAKDRDVLLRLAKAGFSAREVTNAAPEEPAP